MSSKIMSLTWNNHDNMVKKQFEMFLKSSVLADCTLSAEGQHLKAHKIMLAACSHYFETLFRQDNMNNFVIVLKDVKLYNLKALLHFMYCGEVIVSQDNIKDFIDTAKSLQVRGLEDEYKKYDLRRTLKKPKLNVISPTHDPTTPTVQMKNMYSDLNDIDETSLTVGISRLSVNSDNYSSYHIQNTTISIHSLPTLTPFELNNVKFSQVSIPEIKSEVQYDSQPQKPVNKTKVQPPTSGLLEKTTKLDNKIEVTKKKPNDLKIQQTTLSKESETFEKQLHHKSVQTQGRNSSKQIPRKHQKAKDMPTDKKLTDLTTSMKANNNKNDDNSLSSSLAQNQTQTTCRRSTCIRASRKPEKLKIHEKKHKSRYDNLFCEICKETFSSTSNFKNHHCSTHESEQSYFTIRECETFKSPVNKSHQYVHRGMQPFLCQFCHTVFRNIRQLQSHIDEHTRSKHRNSMPFMCLYCQRSFMNIKHLQYHLNEHKRNRFLFQEWAMRHRQNRLLHSRDPVFVCPICRKAFTKKVYLREHQYFHDRK